MKKTYISPALEAVMLDNKTSLCVGSMPINKDNDSGTGQLSKKFWGAAPWETREEAAEEEENDSWY